MENENVNVKENELNENVESTEMVVQEQSSSIMSFADLKSNSNTKMDMITNINDKKELYNIDNSTPDALLNDCVGEKIRAKKVLIKKYEKPLKEPVFDETTGEIIKDTETTMSVVLIDDNGKTYATGSKTFGWQLIRYLRDYDNNIENGLEIEIVKNKVAGTNNKALGFKLV